MQGLAGLGRPLAPLSATQSAGQVPTAGGRGSRCRKGHLVSPLPNFHPWERSFEPPHLQLRLEGLWTGEDSWSQGLSSRKQTSQTCWALSSSALLNVLTTGTGEGMELSVDNEKPGARENRQKDPAGLCKSHLQLGQDTPASAQNTWVQLPCEPAGAQFTGVRCNGSTGSEQPPTGSADH